MSTLIADDEPLARAGLREMLSTVSWLECVGEAAHGEAAVEAINRLQPELVLLDIQMPGLLGTDVLRRCTHRPHVIFTTAYSHHAVTAFELGALDYVLKPFGQVRLEAALERARTALGEPAAHSAVDRLNDALGKLPMTRLFVRTGAQLVPVPVDSIAIFEASGDYVVAHVGGSRHVVHVSLSRIEGRLDPSRFVRIHRTHIVNMSHVVRFRAVARGGLVAEMADGTRLPVSRTRASELRRLAE
ncbi:MAG TPA: LytTR family DNA-binding domain-containing protein [Gemmatimonas sp.]|nr:LytTR family DNA-binding domain-containing protein [Gemmatimonas sp.]